MDGATFIKRFREETFDEADPPLWSDSLILRYLDEAQTEFCRSTEGLEDGASSVCRLEVSAGTSTPRLSSKILKVRAASLVEPQRQLVVMSVEEARAEGIIFGSARPGAPRLLITGLGGGKVQLFPVPAQDCTIRLDVFRLPLSAIEVISDETEVDDRHAQTLMHYALYRAYSRPDPDTMDRVRADYFLQQFREECARAQREQGRARKPNGVTQFSW